MRHLTSAIGCNPQPSSSKALPTRSRAGSVRRSLVKRRARGAALGRRRVRIGRMRGRRGSWRPAAPRQFDEPVEPLVHEVLAELAGPDDTARDALEADGVISADTQVRRWTNPQRS